VALDLRREVVVERKSPRIRRSPLGQPATPSRAPRKRDRDATQAQLLAAAEAEFLKRGPFAASVNVIARSAGINKRMIYHYFHSKAGLYEAVLRANFQKAVPVIAETLAETTDADAVLAGIVRRFCVFLRDHPTYVQLLAWEECAGGETLARLLPETIAEALEAVRRVHQAAVTAGRYRPDIDPNLFIVLVNALCHFPFARQKFTDRLLGPDDEERFERLVRHIVSLLLYGIRTRPA
jgi:AcrR family transcriptional regulator